MKKIIYCEECSGVIDNKEDLVTAQLRQDVFPYHEECYARGLKGAKALYLRNKPINGFSGNFTALMFFMLGLGFLIFGVGDIKYFSLLTLISLAIRLYSYIMFERHLD